MNAFQGGRLYNDVNVLKNHWTVLFEQVNFMMYETYLNKGV